MLSLVAVSEDYLLEVCRLLIVTAALVSGHRPWACELSSCGTWAELPHGKWNLQGQGIKPRSPVLQVDSLSSELPGKLKEMPN